MANTLLFVTTLMAWQGISGNPPLLSAQAAKKAFYQYEPIEIEIIILNPGPSNVSIALLYPSLAQPESADGISFNVTGSRLKLKPETEFEKVFKLYRVPVNRIEPGRHWRRSIYLQRFLEQPDPGEYKLPFKISIAYDFQTPDGKKGDGIAQLSGMLQFEIVEKNDDQLKRIYQQQLDREKYGTEASWWEAPEGLATINYRLVLPFLVKLMQQGHTEKALDALARFPKEKEAQQAVIDVLKSKYRTEVMPSLKVLTKWKHRLSPEQVKELVSRQDDTINRYLREYVEAIGDEELRQLVPPKKD